MSQPPNIEEVMQRIRAQVTKESSAAPAKSPSTPSNQVESVNQGESVARILDRIREKVQGGKAADAAVASTWSSSGSPEIPPSGPELMAPIQTKFHELSQLRVEAGITLEGSRETGQLNPRNPGPINAIIQSFKKVMRRSLTWYTRPLHKFQGGVVRGQQQTIELFNNYREQIEKLADRSNRLAEALERSRQSLASSATVSASISAATAATEQRLAARMDKLEATLPELKSGLSGLEDSQTQQVESLRTELRSQRNELQTLIAQFKQVTSEQRAKERDIRRLVQAVEQGGLQPPGSVVTPVPPMFRSEIKREAEFDYFVFEEHYRGNEAVIRQRQQTYVEYFRGMESVVDIGCGRGEFLELLRDNGISARGVELGTDQYLLCKEKGLDVVQQDLFSFLESTADESLGGVFSAQVLEHMTASDQLRYVALAYQKTKPGSPVIFETINPECVYALVRNFFLDPTHVRPIHPETLRFAMESTKFRNVELRFSSAATDQQIPPLTFKDSSAGVQEFNAAIQRLNRLLYGYQDFAAIGWK
jgi:O-antigen chain-terminating methyltransferase